MTARAAALTLAMKLAAALACWTLFSADASAKNALACGRFMTSSRGEADATEVRDEASDKAWNQARARELLGAGLPARAPLRFATLNVFGLRAPLFGNPRYEESRARMKAALDRWLSGPRAPAVVFLQEVWAESERDRLLAVARERGYGWIERGAQEGGERSGLTALYDRSRFSEILASGFASFDEVGQSVRSAWERAARVERGLQWALLRTTEGDVVFAGHVHLTPFSRHRNVRARQLESLARLASELSRGADLAVIGGDLNESEGLSSAFDRVASRAGLPRLVDAFRAVHDPDERAGATDNPGFEPPLGLRLLRAIAGPPSRRLDYLFVSERSGRTGVYVARAETVFESPTVLDHEIGVADGDHFSDHLGVEAELWPFARRP